MRTPSPIFLFDTQEPVLFTGSIRENIERGKPGATTAAIEKAAKSAFAHDFITSFAVSWRTSGVQQTLMGQVTIYLVL